MQQQDIQQVKEVYSPQEANRLLSQGWVLVAVVAATSQNAPPAIIPCYVLGQAAPAP